MRPEHIPDPDNFLSDLVLRTVDQEFLCIDTAEKRYPSPVVTRKRDSIHILSPRLQRVQALHARINQPVDNAVNRPAGMKKDLIPVPVRLPGEFQKPGEDEPVKMGRADHQIPLCAKVVAEKVTVDL